MSINGESESDRLNRILEESLEAVFQNDVPNLLDSISASVSNLQTNMNQFNTLQEQEQERGSALLNILRDVSFNQTVSYPPMQDLGIVVPDPTTVTPDATSTSTTMTMTNAIPSISNNNIPNETIPIETTLVPSSIIPNQRNVSINESNDFVNQPDTPIPSIHEPTTDTIPHTTTQVNTQTPYAPVPSERYLDMFDDFTARWFRYLQSHQEQMRLYQQNTLQMVRVSQTLSRVLQVNMRPFQVRESASSSTSSSASTSASASASTSASAITDPNTPFILSSRQNNLIPTHVRNFLSQNGFETDIQGFSIPLPSLLQNAVTTGLNTVANTRPSFPTISQVLENTERFILNEDNSIRVDDRRCPISLEDFQLGEELCEIKHCHHVFKWSSLQNWFSRNSHCPVCRYDIRTVVNSNE